VSKNIDKNLHVTSCFVYANNTLNIIYDVNFWSIYNNNVIIQFYSEFLYFRKRFIIEFYICIHCIYIFTIITKKNQFFFNLSSFLNCTTLQNKTDNWKLIIVKLIIDINTCVNCKN